MEIRSQGRSKMCENNPMDALRNAMIIGALPFTMVMGLMCIALAKALWRDGRRQKAGILQAEVTAQPN